MCYSGRKKDWKHLKRFENFISPAWFWEDESLTMQLTYQLTGGEKSADFSDVYWDVNHPAM